MAELTTEAREALKQLRDDGLVWLANTAILHPRGFALAVHFDEGADPETALPTGLSILGDGSEPWVFGYDQVDDPGVPYGLVRRYMAAEARREAEWSARLNPDTGAS